MSEELKEPAQLREAYDKLQKEVVPKLEKQVAELQSANRVLKVEGLFTSPEVGLTAQQARLYPAEAELTVEAVKAFAEEFNLSPAQASGGTATEEPVESQGEQAQGGNVAAGTNLSLVGRAGSGSGSGGQPPSGQEKMSTTEWFELKQRDPEAAEKARAAGRVELREDNFYRQRGKVQNL